MASPLYRYETSLPLPKLLRLWCAAIPDTSEEDLLDVFLTAALAGEFDRADAGRPGVLFEVVANELVPVTGDELRHELAMNHGYCFARLAEWLRATRGAVGAFVAARPVLPLPPFWAPEPAPAHAPQGRKVNDQSSNAEIGRAADTMIKAGEVDFGYGGLRRMAKALHPKFPNYQLDTIEKIIGPMFREAKKKRQAGQ